MFWLQGFALASQRDAVINIKIAEAACRDGKALQSIQYISNRWWIFLAVSGYLLTGMAIIMFFSEDTEYVAPLQLPSRARSSKVACSNGIYCRPE
jgi:uncharacterized membrane protein